MFEKNGSTSGMQPASTFIIIIPMIFGSLGVQRFIFPTNLELVVLVSQQIYYRQMTLSLKPGNTVGTVLHRNPRSKVPIFVKINKISAMHVQKDSLDSYIS